MTFRKFPTSDRTDIYIYVIIILNALPFNIEHTGRRKAIFYASSNIAFLSPVYFILEGKAYSILHIHYIDVIIQIQYHSSYFTVFSWISYFWHFHLLHRSTLANDWSAGPVGLVGAASFQNCPIWPVLDGIPKTVQSSFSWRKYNYIVRSRGANPALWLLYIYICACKDAF